MATALAARSALPSDDLRSDRAGRIRWRIGLDRWIGWLLPLLFLVAIFPILDMVYWISAKALPTLTWTVLADTTPTYQFGLGVAIIGTFEIMLLATLLSVGLGLLGGIATAEFLGERSASWVRMSANLLVGTPSVVVGYFGYFAFVLYFGWGLSYIAGVFTLAFFMTPYVFRTADLAFTSVPRPIREAAMGSGAKAHQYILRIGTPIAFPQILTGIFLAMAIGVGETAPLVLTTTPGVLLPQTLYSPVTFLTGLIWTDYNGSTGPGYQVLAFQAAFLLLIVVIVVNVVVRIIAARYRKRLEGLYQ
jgi:phosphate transport system permease protein